MLIWSGPGVLVFGIVFLVSLVSNVLFDSVLGSGFYTSHTWAAGIAVMLSSPVVWLVGRRCDHRGGRTVVDRATGEQITLGKPHFFFLPMRFWGPLLFFVGLVTVVRFWK